MAVKSRVTLDEFLLMEDQKPALEYACGEVFQKSMPNRKHSKIQIFLGVVLFQFLAKARIGEALTEFRCVFGPRGRERAFVPDLVYVANEHVTAEDYLRIAPDLAVEILSPGQNVARLLDKTQFYLLHGVRLVWMIDPEAATIAVLSPTEESRSLFGGDTLDGGDVLPGFSVAVDDIFAQLRPEPRR